MAVQRDKRFTDERIVVSSGNVFVDLGFDEAEARVLTMRTELLIRLRERVEKKGWTQVEAARRLHVTQPRVSSLMRGKWEDFSVDMLLTLAGRVGLRAHLKVAA